MKRFLPVLSLGLLSLALAQESPNYKLTEHVFTAGGHPQGGTTPVSARYAPSAVGESFEDDCRVCHDSGVPDRHHLLSGQPIPQGSVVPYPDANGDGAPEVTYGCLNCHDANFTVVRDCVACHTSPVGTVPDGTALAEDPLTVTVTALGALTLSWDPSCSVSDTDYAVYEGALGNFASHAPVLCSIDGATSATFPPPAGNAYYLVVPRNHWSEGSYGLEGDGAQRPPSGSACLSQSIGCP